MVESHCHTPGEQTPIHFTKTVLLSVGGLTSSWLSFFALFILFRCDKMNMSSLSLIKKKGCAINHFVFYIFG